MHKINTHFNLYNWNPLKKYCIRRGFFNVEYVVYFAIKIPINYCKTMACLGDISQNTLRNAEKWWI